MCGFVALCIGRSLLFFSFAFLHPSPVLATSARALQVKFYKMKDSEHSETPTLTYGQQTEIRNRAVVAKRSGPTAALRLPPSGQFATLCPSSCSPPLIHDFRNS